QQSLRQSGLSQAVFKSGEIFRAAKRGPILYVGNAQRRSDLPYAHHGCGNVPTRPDWSSPIRYILQSDAGWRDRMQLDQIEIGQIEARTCKHAIPAGINLNDANFFVAMSQSRAPGSSCHRNPGKEWSNDCQG